MTVQTLYTAATGMEALETKLDVIANNMANINTTGFKKDRANFEDIFYRHYRLPGATDADGNITSTGIEVGLGTIVQHKDLPVLVGTHGAGVDVDIGVKLLHGDGEPALFEHQAQSRRGHTLANGAHNPTCEEYVFCAHATCTSPNDPTHFCSSCLGPECGQPIKRSGEGGASAPSPLGVTLVGG